MYNILKLKSRFFVWLSAFLVMSQSVLGSSTFIEHDISELFVGDLAPETHGDRSWAALLGGKLKHDSVFLPTEDGHKFYLYTGQTNDWLKHEMLLAVVNLLNTEIRNQFICDYPARSLWLAKRFEEQIKAIDFSHCHDLTAWSNIFINKDFHLAFASSDYSSPASIFGHTFLALSSNDGTYLDGYSIGYAAHFEDNRNSLSYFARGITGGYPGVISVVPLHKTIKEYTLENQRDVYFFKLRLTEAQKRLIIFSLWERRRAKFDYFFTHENCSYMMLQILQTVEPRIDFPKGLLDQVVPFETIKAAERAGLISSASVISASKKIARKISHTFSKEDQKLLRELIDGKISFDQWLLKNNELPVWFALQYLNIAITQDSLDRVRGRDLRQKLLRVNFDSASHKEITPVTSRTDVQNVDKLFGAHPPNRISYSFNKSEALGDSLDINMRWAYHDLLDPVSATLKYASVEAMSGTLRIRRNNIKIQRIDLVSVKSLPDFSILFPEKSKNFNLGLVRHDLTDNRLALSMSWGRGLASHFAVSDVAFALINFDVKFSPEIDNFLAFGYSTELGINGNLSDKSRFLVSAKNTWYPSENYEIDTYYLGINYLFGDTSSITFELNRQISPAKSELTIAAVLKYLF